MSGVAELDPVDTVIEDRGDEYDPDAAAEASAKDDAAAEIEKIEAEKAAKPEHKKGVIPVERHEKILAKEREQREALAAQLAKYQAGGELSRVNENIDATEIKLVEMEAAYNKLLGEGEIEKATTKMTEIRRLERTIGDQKADFKAAQASAEAYERVKYDTVVGRVEGAYPELNPDHEEFDRATADEVMDLFRSFAKDGLDRSAALQKAVKYVMRADTGKQKTAVDVDPRISAEQVAKERKAAGLKRNVDASNRQPADTSRVGLDSDKAGSALTALGVSKMSYSQFAKLSEAELSKLRGDTL